MILRQEYETCFLQTNYVLLQWILEPEVGVWGERVVHVRQPTLTSSRLPEDCHRGRQSKYVDIIDAVTPVVCCVVGNFIQPYSVVGVEHKRDAIHRCTSTLSKMAPCQVTQLILVRNAVKTFSKCHYFSRKWTFPIICHKIGIIIKNISFPLSKSGWNISIPHKNFKKYYSMFLEGKYWYLSPFEMYQSVLILFRHPICIYPKNFKDLCISNTFILEGIWIRPIIEVNIVFIVLL